MQGPAPLSPALHLVIAYNTPFVAWTGYALYRAFWSGSDGGWSCPVHHLFNWCPGCGLTGDYARLLQGQPPAHVWFWLIFILFVVNALWSIRQGWIMTNIRR